MAGTPKIEYNSPTVTITFDFPPSKDPLNEQVSANFKTTVSSNGTTQTTFFYNEEIVTIKFKFVSKTITDLVRTMYEDWLALGKTISYFPDKDIATSYDYTWAGKSFNVDRDIPDSGDYLYNFDLKFRRVKT